MITATIKAILTNSLQGKITLSFSGILPASVQGNPPGKCGFEKQNRAGIYLREHE